MTTLYEKDSPETKSPAVKEMQESLRFVRDVAEGWPHVAGVFLKQFAAEHDEDFKARKDRPNWEDFLNPVVDGAAGRLFQQEPQLTGDARAAELWEDIDGRGNRGNVFAYRVARDALLAGQRFILVDFPRAQEGEGRQEGARAYWVSIALDAVTSFDFEYRAGVAHLTLFAFQERVTSRVGFIIKTVDQWRVFRHELDTGAITYELWRREAGHERGEPVRVEGPTPLIGISAIPVVSVNMSATGDFTSDPPFLALAQQNVNLYRTTSDMDRAHELASYPTLFGAGVSDTTAEGEPIAMGPGTRIFTENTQAKLEYVAGDGKGVELALKRRESIRDSMAISGLNFLQENSKQGETATARALKGEFDSDRVRTWAETLEDALNLAWVLTAEWESMPTAPFVTFATPKPVMSEQVEAAGESAIENEPERPEVGIEPEEAAA